MSSSSQSDKGLRERKNAHTEEKSNSIHGDESEQEHKTTITPTGQSSLTIPRFLYVALALILAGVLYQYPEFVLSLLVPWIGFSKPTLPGFSSDAIPDLTADIAKRDAVVDAFKHAWLSYERDAMGDDEYHPIAHTGANLSEAGGIGYTVIDSMDTMLIMGLHDEASRAREWINTNLSFDRNASYNTFETTIRVLGGLLSAYHLSDNDSLYLKHAIDIADRLLSAFATPAGLPLSMVNLAEREGIPDLDNAGFVSTAEVATLQLEFRYLSYLTDDDMYWKVAEKVMAVIRQNTPKPRVVPIFMRKDPDNGQFLMGPIRLGSRGDSYYEYLLKQFLQTAQKESVYMEMYNGAVDDIHIHLIKKSLTSHLTYTAELIPQGRPGPGQQPKWSLLPKQDHLVCFLGGLLMLGATTTGAVGHVVSIPPRYEELTSQGRRDWKTGVELTQTCVETHNTATGLSPEIVHFRIPSDNVDIGSRTPNDWYIKGSKPGSPPSLDARYILRPETVESLFVAFRLTGDKRYRDYGWKIFEAIEKHCKISTGGYASVINVDELPVEHEDKMETFMMSETLKYLYLLFADGDVMPLSDYVFNTEAHPLPIFSATIRTGFS